MQVGRRHVYRHARSFVRMHFGVAILTHSECKYKEIQDTDGTVIC